MPRPPAGDRQASPHAAIRRPGPGRWQLALFVLAMHGTPLLALRPSASVAPAAQTVMIAVLPNAAPAAPTVAPPPPPAPSAPAVRGARSSTPLAASQAPPTPQAASAEPTPANAPAAVDTPPAAPAPAQAAPNPAGDTAPSYHAAYLHNPQPPYPLLSRKLRESGSVRLRVRVDAGGRPETVAIAASSGFARLDEAARGAVGEWQFVPARQQGQAVAGWVEVPIQFNLEK